MIKKLMSNKLIKQLFNFGIVGVLAFFVELLFLNLFIQLILPAIFKNGTTEFYTLIASPIAFCISVIFNYVMSMLFVFKKREDVNGGQVFIIFVLLNIIALALNQLIMWLFVGFFNNENYNVAKVVATGVVTIYNFISRKLFIEERPKENQDEK